MTYEELEKMNKEAMGKVTKRFVKNSKGEKEEVVVEPETKVCPFCLSEVKYKATKCPHCTSVLEDLIKE